VSNNEILLNISKDSSFSFTNFFLKKTIYSKEKLSSLSLSPLSLSLSLSHEDFPSYEHLLALFTIICKLVPTKVINVAPKCSLGQKTKSFSQKYLGLGKSQGEGVSHCL
jgi:hypothetical protein